MEAQIEQLEQRYGILVESIQTPNSKFASVIDSSVQCESQGPPDLLEVGGLARLAVDVEKLEMPIGELRGD